MTKAKKSAFSTTRRRFLAGATGAAVTPFLIRTSKAQDPELVLKLATPAPRGTPWYSQLKAIKKEAKAGSGDRIKIKAYPGSALGDEISTLDSCKRGRIHMWAGTSGALASKVPTMGCFELPYLFPSLSAADKAIDAIFNDIDAELQKAGLKLLFVSENGHRSIGMKGVGVKSPKDLVGKKVRAQQGFVHENTWKALGASPVPIPVTEVLTSLQNGVVEGFDNTPLFTFAGSWYQAITDFTLTEHCYQPGFVVMHLDTWKGLSKADQALILNDPAKRAKEGRAGVRKLGPALIKNFGAAGIKVHKLNSGELAAFKSATKGTHAKFKSKYGGGLLDKLKKNM